MIRIVPIEQLLGCPAWIGDGRVAIARSQYRHHGHQRCGEVIRRDAMDAWVRLREAPKRATPRPSIACRNSCASTAAPPFKPPCQGRADRRAPGTLPLLG